MIDVQNKKVGILGYGVNNAELVPWLLEHGAHVSILDKNPALVHEFSNVHYELGDQYLHNLQSYDILFRTPGLPYLTPEIQAAKQAGVVITSQTQLFFDLCPATIVGVTGTKGKGTTASFIESVLQSARKNNDIAGTIHLAGNIGTSPISLLPTLTKQDWVILELSSFQLQDLTKSPHIAVVLQVSEDHLDHHKSIEEYHEAKRSIVRYQTNHDFAVINAESPVALNYLHDSPTHAYFYAAHRELTRGAFLRGEAIYVITDTIPETRVVEMKELQVVGRHNLENAAAATLAGLLAGASLTSIKEGLRNFPGLPFRLQKIATKCGITYYNDSFATQPDATIVAIESFTQPITLIAGGSTKGADFTLLAQAIATNHVKNVVCIGDEGQKIAAALRLYAPSVHIIDGASTMSEIVGQATRASQPGGIVLLSPACASFGLFKDYKDRGNQFNKAVEMINE